MRAQQRRGGGAWLAAVGVVLLGGVMAAVLLMPTGAPEPAPAPLALRGGPPAQAPAPVSDNPLAGRALYVYDQSSAARAAELATGTPEGDAFARLASTPTAIWLVPEVHPAEEVAAFVTGVQADAAAKAQLPVYVVYGLPGRDCGNYSSGGTDPDGYAPWIAAIASGLAGHESVVVVEPDALALSVQCGTQNQATAYVRSAVAQLGAVEGAAVYVDAGNSNWLPPDVMAPLLAAAGVDLVRGFATNVANFNTTQDERAYGEALSALLGGKHYVVDTSRNGSGSTGEWCNPPGRTVGESPVAVEDGSAQDASLWIKVPGESDGSCNGGPPAGWWWADQALGLLG